MTHPLQAVQPRTCVVCGWRPLGPGQPYVDTRCETRIREHLMELADLALLLPLVVGVSRGDGGRLPVRVAVLDLTLPARTRPVRPANADLATGESIAATLAWWAVHWSYTAPATGYQPSNSVGSLGLWLYDQMSWAVQVNPSIDEMAADVRGQLANARRALNCDLRPERYTAACRCGEARLTREAGADWIRCGACGRIWEMDYLGELARETVPDDALLYAGQAATAVGVHVERVWKWASRGKVEAHPDEEGRPRYRLGDLRDVQRQFELHRSGRCEIGLLVVLESGEIVPGELIEYDAPATVVATPASSAPSTSPPTVVRRGETRWLGPAPAGAIVVNGAPAFATAMS